ncbi:siderophore-interacting protein [Thalassococcus sp. S3]|uniref:siderophore-interacting protein n=1 Tax=Thalassococcus sp. S3 TaxID=2017482 RepID=UPI0010243CB0|nr:siderophore-interacting protein [Thalassococcus sp. S3]QBF33463.1 hypothetical protein CFI11_19935 [Thalassococcus sp. S3]
MPENTTLLPLPAEPLLDLLRKEAEEHDLECTQTDGWLDLSTQYGIISARIDDGAVLLRLSSETEGELTVLRDAVNAHVSGQFVPKWSNVRTGRPPNLTVLRLAGKTQISPSFLRLTLSGDTHRLTGAGFHIRFVAPAAGKPHWPRIDATGRTIWFDKTPLPHRPVYTIAEVRAGQADIDIFRHEGGRTIAWADSLEVGDPVGVLGPGGSGLPEANRLSLWGDETAMPAIRRILSEAPEDTVGKVTIAVRDPDDIFLWGRRGFEVRWLVRSDPTTLAHAMIADRAGADKAYLWFAAGAAETKIARQHAAELNIAKQRRHIAAYWT